MLYTMKHFAWLAALIILPCAHAHAGDRERAKDDQAQNYAQRHMASEHHIDSFDIPSFFQLHDLDSDGFWDRGEIESIYGVHHVYAQKLSKDDVEHQGKADLIVKAVLELLDKNKDGRVSVEELKAVGLEGLPSFESLGAEGHHYDVESEFFLHHEEEFHSTPETQTDESYIHPEDIEHFAHHEDIEREEAEKEAKFQGISVEEVLKQHDEALRHTDDRASPVDGESSTPEGTTPPKYPRGSKLIKPENVAKKEALLSQPEWGTGDRGYNQPKSPIEKLRKNMPYKYKFKRNWGDF